MNPNQTYYKHQTKESFVSKLVKRLLIYSDRKTSLVKIFETKKFKRLPAPIPNSLRKVCQIDEIVIQNRPVWKLIPKNNKSNKLIFYSHGGGHVNNIISFQWKMIEYLINKTGATFIVPDYPLLPEHNYKDTFAMVEEAFKKTVQNVESKDLIFLGDSAGGAISLALSQLLRDQEYVTQPSQIILISPELDSSKIHKDVDLYEPNDVMLTKEIFNVIIPHYVADCPRNNFLVSPGLGNLNNLGIISIFAGTHDILFPYALDLKKRLEDENKAFNFYEYPKMIHVWAAITLMKEARSALNQISILINKD